MKYNPKAADQELPAGQYEAVVKKAIESVSKNLNPMMELIVTVYGPEGQTVDVFDYLPSTDSMVWKLRHFCESAGIDFDRGDIHELEMQDCNVRVNLTLEQTEKYGKQNKITDYLPRATGFTDDDIPF